MLSGREELIRKEAPERRMRERRSRGDRVVSRRRNLEPEGLLDRPGIPEGQPHLASEEDRGLRHDPVDRLLDVAVGLEADRARDELRALLRERTDDPVAAARKVERDRALLARLEHLLEQDVRALAGRACAERLALERADARMWREDELDRVLQIPLEGGRAGGAGPVLPDMRKLGVRLVGDHALRADDVPGRLEQPDPGRVNEGVGGLGAILVPRIRERVRADRVKRPVGRDEEMHRDLLDQ